MAEPTIAKVRRRTVAMKLEATYGTDALATVAAADVLWAFNIRPASRIEAFENPGQAGFLGRMPPITSREFFGISFDMLVRGAGAAYSASVVPDIHMPLQAAGFLATVDTTAGLEKWTYTPRSTGFESFSVAMTQENGPTVKGVGCFANIAFRARAGEPMVATVTLAGALASEGTLALVTKTPTTLQAPPLKSAGATIDTGNYALKVGEVSLDLGNVISPIADWNAVSALLGFFLADRAPRGTIDPEVVAAATYDYFTKWRTKPSNVDLIFNVRGADPGTQYNRFSFTMPQITIDDRPWGERDGVSTFPVGFSVHPGSGNDELTIVAS